MLFIHLPELPGRAAPFGLEHSIEIGQIVESAFIADFRYVPCGVNQHPGGKSKPDVGNIIGQFAVSPDTEETAECHRTHSREGSKVIEPELLGIMVVDVLFHFLDPADFLVPGSMGK